MSRELTGRNPKDPVARQTPLGWVCFGPTNKNHSHRTTHAHMTRACSTNQTNMDQTNYLLRKFWELQAIGINDGSTHAMTQDEIRAIRTAKKEN